MKLKHPIPESCVHLSPTNKPANLPFSVLHQSIHTRKCTSNVDNHTYWIRQSTKMKELCSTSHRGNQYHASNRKEPNFTLLVLGPFVSLTVQAREMATHSLSGCSVSYVPNLLTGNSSCGVDCHSDSKQNDRKRPIPLPEWKSKNKKLKQHCLAWIKWSCSSIGLP